MSLGGSMVKRTKSSVSSHAAWEVDGSNLRFPHSTSFGRKNEKTTKWSKDHKQRNGVRSKSNRSKDLWDVVQTTINEVEQTSVNEVEQMSLSSITQKERRDSNH